MGGGIFEVLLIDDSPDDILLTQEAFAEVKIPNKISYVEDGEEAIKYLKKEGKYINVSTPHIIILDLNLPKKRGKEVLNIVKSSSLWCKIPVVIMTTSNDTKDIEECYDLHANCYIEKPVDIERFFDIVKNIGNYWFNIVTLPY